MAFSNYYPGNEYLDALSLDVYGSDYKQDYYDTLLKMSKGKPLVLGEVGSKEVGPCQGAQYRRNLPDKRKGGDRA